MFFAQARFEHPPDNARDMTQIYVSDNNVGAKELGLVLQQTLKKRATTVLRITDDPTEMASKHVEHFLFLVSASLFDDYECDDAETAAYPNALFNELKIALQNDVHIIVVHDCRDAFYYVSKEANNSGYSGTSNDRNSMMAHLPMTERGNGVPKRGTPRRPSESARSRLVGVGDASGGGGAIGSVRKSLELVGRRNTMSLPRKARVSSIAIEESKLEDGGRASATAVGEMIVIGRYAPFGSIHSRTPSELVKLRLYEELALPLYGRLTNDPYSSVAIDQILRAVLTLPKKPDLSMDSVIHAASTGAQKVLGRAATRPRGSSLGGALGSARLVEEDGGRGGEEGGGGGEEDANHGGEGSSGSSPPVYKSPTGDDAESTNAASRGSGGSGGEGGGCGEGAAPSKRLSHPHAAMLGEWAGSEAPAAAVADAPGVATCPEGNNADSASRRVSFVPVAADGGARPSIGQSIGRPSLGRLFAGASGRSGRHESLTEPAEGRKSIGDSAVTRL